MTAPDIEQLFIKAGLAVSGIMARKTGHARGRRRFFRVELDAGNREELLVAWLNEIISVSAAERIVVSEIEIERLEANSLRGRISGVDVAAYHIEKDIKAATYHRLRLEQSPGGWKAEVIFDV